MLGLSARVLVASDVPITPEDEEDKDVEEGHAVEEDKAVEGDNAVEEDKAVEGDNAVEADKTVEGDKTVDGDKAVEEDNTVEEEDAAIEEDNPVEEEELPKVDVEKGISGAEVTRDEVAKVCGAGPKAQGAAQEEAEGTDRGFFAASPSALSGSSPGQWCLH